jgi:xylan 1,4-beta-xylosidase
MNIKNPVLTGFNPDPSIVRVGDDYYIATSTFEWFPGVQIHHSRDLVHWRLLCHPLDRRSQLDMRGCEHSCGIWAPNLTYADGQFWLLYTNVRSSGGPWKDTPNYLVTAPEITGPWSEPVFLNASGFDPSLFHAEDGRKYVTNMLWNGRGNRHRFDGIVLQEYDSQTCRLTGPVSNIWKGSGLPCTEGPNLYFRNDWYYLVCAEGGTGWNHTVTVGRSRNLTGPYELHPDHPMLTSKGLPADRLQKAGHGAWFETQAGEWYMSHLCSRPVFPVDAPVDAALETHGRSILGRESAIQKFIWCDDDWPRLAQGGNAPAWEVSAPDLPPHPWPEEATHDDFDCLKLNINFQTLREPLDPSWGSLSERPGWLRLRGRNSLFSTFEQSLVARRIQYLRCEASTLIDFNPQTYQQMAGLIAYYDRKDYYYLRITADDEGRRVLGLVVGDNGAYQELPEAQVILNHLDPVHLRVQLDHTRLQFFWSTDGAMWSEIGLGLESTLLSDEHGTTSCFTGPFFGLCCQDMSGRGLTADFDGFDYQPQA